MHVKCAYVNLIWREMIYLAFVCLLQSVHLFRQDVAFIVAINN